MTNKEEYKKMLAGEVYNAVDPYLIEQLNLCKDKCWRYNQLQPTRLAERNAMLREILGEADDKTFINQPFYCDYGSHIRVGKRFFANFNWVVLDEAPVTIGDDCFIGPHVSIYTACHSTTILPGVTIGDNVTIGAGSVVVHDIPSNSVAVGNPARVIRHLE